MVLIIIPYEYMAVMKDPSNVCFIMLQYVVLLLPVTMHDICKLRNNMAIGYALYYYSEIACMYVFLRIIRELLSCMWNE